jgi:very-short-patch-repair endonuclease
MWNMLRVGFPAARFRRQVPIRHFIVDFASHEARLVIEVDGGHHSPERDSARTKVSEGEGYRLVRFWNDEVLGNGEGVWSVIDFALQADHPLPASPIEGEEARLGHD